MPGLFYLNYGSTQAAILNSDGSINSAGNPAQAGDEIAIFGTGAGLTSPVGVTGGFWGGGTDTLLTLPMTVQIGGVNAPVVYAGAAPGLLSGVFQVNVQVPPGVAANAAADIQVAIAGQYFSQAATVAVQ